MKSKVSYDGQRAVNAIGSSPVVAEDQEMSLVLFAAANDCSVLYDSLSHRSLPTVAIRKRCDCAFHRGVDAALEEVSLRGATPHIRFFHQVYELQYFLVALAIRLAVLPQLGCKQRLCLARGRTCACATCGHTGVVA